MRRRKRRRRSAGAEAAASSYRARKGGSDRFQPFFPNLVISIELFGFLFGYPYPIFGDSASLIFLLTFPLILYQTILLILLAVFSAQTSCR